jgi:hypothetical protein
LAVGARCSETSGAFNIEHSFGSRANAAEVAVAAAYA